VADQYVRGKPLLKLFMKTEVYSTRFIFDRSKNNRGLILSVREEVRLWG
jgi:hypothetical protein